MTIESFVFGIVAFVLGVALGTWFGVWYAEYVKRPQLRLSGGGSASTPFRRSTLTVNNDPGWIGVGMGESTILGRRIHRGFRRGLAIDRNPAKQCQAQLIDKAKGRTVTSLVWQVRDDPDHYEPLTTLAGGESRVLMLFAAVPSEPSAYFVFEPDAGSPYGIRVPDERLRFTGDNEFEVRVNYSNDSTLRVDVAMTVDYRGNLYVEQRQKGRGGSSSLFSEAPRTQ